MCSAAGPSARLETSQWHPAPITSPAHSNLANFSKATELKSRIWFTVGALVVFRFLSFVPLPDNPLILESLASKTRGGILDIFNAFLGGSLERMSLIALGVMPYITASIVVQLAASLHPRLMALKKEGESGRKKLNQYTRYGAGPHRHSGLVPRHRARSLWCIKRSAGRRRSGYVFRIGAVVSLIGGTMFLLWLGEQITSRGIGNGVSLIIMAWHRRSDAHVLRQPVRIRAAPARSARSWCLACSRMLVGVVIFICFFERASRRLLVQYPKRVTQQGHDGGGSQSPAL